MPAAPFCVNLNNSGTDAPIAMVLQPVMSYTRRLIGYEVKCSQPWGLNAVRWTAKLGLDDESPASLFLTQVGDSLPIFTVSPSMGIEHCTATFPAGALLLLEAGPSSSLIDVGLLAHCCALQSAGFQVGIGDYRGEPFWAPLIPALSHIRFSCKGPLLAPQQVLLKSPLRRRVTLIASDVETSEDLRSAMQAGFQLFQGSFAHRITRLHWPPHEFQQRALLLQEVCKVEAAGPELLARALDYGSLCMRFDRLLLSIGKKAPVAATNLEVLQAELGPQRVQQLLQISLAEDMTGSSCPTLMVKLFQQARFHELMRSFAAALPSSTARFEGIMLGTLAAITERTTERSAFDDVASLLKHSLGTHMECGALHRNLAIADAYGQARWSEAERLGRADGFAPAELIRIFQEATLWAHRYVKPHLLQT